MTAARSMAWAVDVARRLLSDHYKTNFRAGASVEVTNPGLSVSEPILLVSEALANGSAAGRKTCIYATADVFSDSTGVTAVVVVAAEQATISSLGSSHVSSDAPPENENSDFKYSKWGVLGGFVHVPPAGSRMAKELLLRVDRTQPSPVELKAGQFIACSFLERAAFSRAGSQQTGYFGPNYTLGLQLRCAEPVAAFTDDVYSLVLFKAYGQLIHELAPIFGPDSIIGGVPFKLFEYNVHSRLACLSLARRFPAVSDPAELIRRTGEKKGSDMSRNGGTRSNEVVGQYVHYNECILPADPRLGKHRVVQCTRRDGRVFIEPRSPWMKTVLKTVLK